jgi:hypothetical protein
MDLEKDLYIKIDFEDKEIRKNFLIFLENCIRCQACIEDIKEESSKKKEIFKKIEEEVKIIDNNFKTLQAILPLAKEKRKERPKEKEIKKEKEEKVEKVEAKKEKKEKETKKMKLQKELEEIRKKLSSI